MFKITDLAEGPEEFKRLRKLLERVDEVNKCMGARKKDIDLSQVAEVTVEKAREMLDKQRKVAIVGGGSSSELVKRIIAEQHGLSLSVESFDTWNFKDLPDVYKLDKPARDWEHTKLRRGPGHNKFKRKGKK